MKKLAYVVVGLIVLVVIVIGAAFAAVNLLDWKPYIVDAAHDATGRQLTIDGAVKVSLSPGLQLDFAADGVHLANAEGAEPADMLALGGISGRVQLWPYLTSRAVVVDSLIVQEPAVNLSVDASGRRNWVFGPEAAAGPRQPSGGEAQPFSRLRIGQLSVKNGSFSYADAVSGQTVKATEIHVDFALTDLDSPLDVEGGMVLNKEPVSLKVQIDTPNGLLKGPEAKTMVALTTKHAKASYQGRVLRQPVDGLDGVFDVDIPSVGRLAAWLDRPLAKGQPDPGPLKVHAVFAGEGTKVTLKEATIQGQALKAKASGTFERSGEVNKVQLALDSDVLDIDRYLPPAKPQAAEAGKTQRPAGNPLAQLSDQPIDLSALRHTDADVKVAIAGVKVAGYQIGKIDFTAQAKGGVLTADLARLALYGGAVSGKLTLDAKADTPALATEVDVDKVKVDQLTEAATGEKSVVGTASGHLKATSHGKSQRALAQNLQGNVDFSLGDVKNAPIGAITAVNLKLELPGIDKQPTLRGDLVYNNEKVDFGAATDPLQKVLDSDRFKADVKVSSKPLSLIYSGAVQRRPVPGLDGRFDLDVPSVAVLAAWLGQPLGKGQPDPGPLKVSAEMATEGDSFLVKQATIKGKALDAKASGSFKAERPVPRFAAKIDVQQANLNAYLPPEEKRPAKAEAAPAAAGWSREPYDFSGLKAANGKAEVTLAKVTYKNLEITKGRITATVEGGVLESNVESLELAGGTLAASARVDAAADGAKVGYKASAKNVEARPLLTAFAGSDRLSGTANIEAEGTSQGRSQWDLVNALNGKGNFTFLNGAIHGINLAATLRKARTLGLSQEAGEEQKTDFAELSGSYVITKGVVDNRDMKMLAPLVRLSGAGQVPMPPQTIDYTVEAKLVPTLKGQGGQDALAGVPIPIRVTGTWQKPEYRVDWNSVIKSIAADPERLANMPQALSDRAKDMGIKLPGAELLKQLPGIGGTQEKSGDTGASGTTAPPPPNPLDALKGLLKK